MKITPGSFEAEDHRPHRAEPPAAPIPTTSRIASVGDVLARN